MKQTPMAGIVAIPPKLIQNEVLLPSSLSENVKDFDTFFFASDKWALEAWQKLEKMGVNTPDDIALMGFDGSYEALKHEPPLTTIEQPCKEIARMVLETVINVVLKGEKLTTKERLVSPVLQIGGST